MEQNYNYCINEAKYIQFLDQQMSAAGIANKGYITDTSRNGVPSCQLNENGQCGPECNPFDCGLGALPSIDTSSTGIPQLIDSFVWVRGMFIINVSLSLIINSVLIQIRENLMAIIVIVAHKHLHMEYGMISSLSH